MANTDTLSKEFRDHIRQTEEADYGEPTARTPLAVRLPETLDEAIRQLPGYSSWVRSALVEAAKRDGLIPDNYGTPRNIG